MDISLYLYWILLIGSGLLAVVLFLGLLYKKGWIHIDGQVWTAVGTWIFTVSFIIYVVGVLLSLYLLIFEAREINNPMIALLAGLLFILLKTGADEIYIRTSSNTWDALSRTMSDVFLAGSAIACLSSGVLSAILLFT